MRPILLAFLLALFGTLHADDVQFDLPETEMPLKAAHEQNDDESTSFFWESEEENATAEAAAETPAARHLYTTLVEKPERLFKGEIFSITLRSIVTTERFDALQYTFSGGTGVERLSEEPEREFKEHAYFDRFYFKATGSRVVLPDITPSVTISYDYDEISKTIPGERIDVTVLNPPKNFCGILAERFTVTHAKTTEYDKRHNIIVFMADANRSDLADFTIASARQQNFESLNVDPHGATMTYYAVLPDTVETLKFQYFNLRTQRFDRISIPIEVDDDLVSTTIDINPIEHGHNYQKSIIFGTTAVLFFLLALWRRSWTLLVFALAAGGYAAWLNIPLREVCIKEGAPIYLLPMRNATVFEITPTRYTLEMQGHVKDYTKVRLLNNKIGWVKDEDTCAY
ncbi:MAG: hypothetical protein P8Y65_04805 [Campylobacterales bacterium]|jgi:hypothetical protein